MVSVPKSFGIYERYKLEVLQILRHASFIERECADRTPHSIERDSHPDQLYGELKTLFLWCSNSVVKGKVDLFVIELSDFSF